MQKIKFKIWTSYFEQFGDRRIDPYLPQVAQFYINIAHRRPILQTIFAYISAHVADTPINTKYIIIVAEDREIQRNAPKRLLL